MVALGERREKRGLAAEHNPIPTFLAGAQDNKTKCEKTPPASPVETVGRNRRATGPAKPRCETRSGRFEQGKVKL